MNKVTFTLRVLLSCNTQDQMVNTVLWAAQILNGDEMKYFVHSAMKVPSFDLAVHNAKQAIIFNFDNWYYDLYQTSN